MLILMLIMDIYGQPYVKLHFSKKTQRLIVQKAMVKGVSIVHQVATDNVFLSFFFFFFY